MNAKQRFAGVFLSLSALCTVSHPVLAAESSLGAIPTGSVIRATREIVAEFPDGSDAARMLGAFGLVFENGKARATFHGSANAACWLIKPPLPKKDPDFPTSIRYRIAKGDVFVIRSLEVSRRPHPLFVGTTVILELVAGNPPDGSVHGEMRCYSGKQGSEPMSVGTFEEVMGGAVEVVIAPGASPRPAPSPSPR
jgi:hypothetical protein